MKRSYLPITLPASISAPQDITASGKAVGELLGTAQQGQGVIGLASIRLDALDGDTRSRLAIMSSPRNFLNG